MNGDAKLNGSRGHAWTAAQHCEDYERHVRTCQAALQEVFDDLEVAADEQSEQLAFTAQSARDAWTASLKSAESRRGALREAIEEARRRTARIRAELSDEAFPDEEESGPPPTSLKATFHTADTSLQLWLQRRAQRQERYEALKEKCRRLREQIGAAGSSVPVNTVTLYAIDGAELELRKLEAEAVERRHRLEVQLKELRRTCLELGEDEGAQAAAIHASLGDSRDAQSSEQDLSDRTFDGLREKILELQELARRREEEGESLLQTLHSLWDALEVPENDVDRELFGRLLQGPSKLHFATIQKCAAEVARLEGERKDLMLSVIQSKRQELASICSSTHMPMPDLPETAGEAGEVADLLARTLKQIRVATEEATQRQAVLGAIRSLDDALADDEWLTQYENDPNKYKGRDSTRKIQRAILAQEHRKQLPAILEGVEAALSSFSASQHKAFKYEGRDYQMAVLGPLKRQLYEGDDQRSQAAKSAPGSARKPTKSALGTPRRAAKTVARSSQDGGYRKPALIPSPAAADRRRRTETGSIQRTASTLSRTDSNASRCESELTGPHGLSERMNKLLNNVNSPPVSRTGSGVSEADRERMPTARKVFPDGVLTGKGESPLKQPNFDIQQEQSENVDVQNVDEHTNGQPLTSGFE